MQSKDDLIKEGEFDYIAFLKLCWRYKWLILMIVVLSEAAAIYIARQKAPSYELSMIIEPPSSVITTYLEAQAKAGNISDLPNFVKFEDAIYMMRTMNAAQSFLKSNANGRLFFNSSSALLKALNVNLPKTFEYRNLANKVVVPISMRISTERSPEEVVKVLEDYCEHVNQLCRERLMQRVSDYVDIERTTRNTSLEKNTLAWKEETKQRALNYEEERGKRLMDYKKLQQERRAKFNGNAFLAQLEYKKQVDEATARFDFALKISELSFKAKEQKLNDDLKISQSITDKSNVQYNISETTLFLLPDAALQIMGTQHLNNKASDLERMHEQHKSELALKKKEFEIDQSAKQKIFDDQEALIAAAFDASEKHAAQAFEEANTFAEQKYELKQKQLKEQKQNIKFDLKKISFYDVLAPPTAEAEGSGRLGIYLAGIAFGLALGCGIIVLMSLYKTYLARN